MDTKYPIFRTLNTPAGAKTAQRTPLPQQKMQSGIATFAEARALQLQLAQDHYTVMGKRPDGYYVEPAPDTILPYLAALEDRDA